ncbi:hypothetical protein I3760_01G062100 [Carya illinoinensis]|nr:hypothetical protein I3760_01G062100 [Carya illinoinensis]
MKVFRDMSSSSKVPPDNVVYNILIDSLCKKNEVELALSLMDEMKVKRLRPNVTAYNVMFKGLREKNFLEKAFDLMDRMVEQACNPDNITMEILTEWLSAVGETGKLKNFVRFEVSVSTAWDGCRIWRMGLFKVWNASVAILERKHDVVQCSGQNVF